MKTITNHEALLEIQKLMNGTEWDSATTSAIAEILERAGYPLADIDEEVKILSR